jgi:hypothetical protein
MGRGSAAASPGLPAVASWTPGRLDIFGSARPTSCTTRRGKPAKDDGTPSAPGNARRHCHQAARCDQLGCGPPRHLRGRHRPRSESLGGRFHESTGRGELGTAPSGHLPSGLGGRWARGGWGGGKRTGKRGWPLLRSVAGRDAEPYGKRSLLPLDTPFPPSFPGAGRLRLLPWSPWRSRPLSVLDDEMTGAADG